MGPVPAGFGAMGTSFLAAWDGTRPQPRQSLTGRPFDAPVLCGTDRSGAQPGVGWLVGMMPAFGGTLWWAPGWVLMGPLGCWARGAPPTSEDGRSSALNWTTIRTRPMLIGWKQGQFESGNARCADDVTNAVVRRRWGDGDWTAAGRAPCFGRGHPKPFSAPKGDSSAQRQNGLAGPTGANSDRRQKGKASRAN